MRKSLRLLACALLGASVLTVQAAFVQPARAQDITTATIGGTTLWVGGGVQFLSLPDIRFTQAGGHRQKNSESDWLDFGGAAGGGFETAIGFWGDYRVTGGIKSHPLPAAVLAMFGAAASSASPAG